MNEQERKALERLMETLVDSVKKHELSVDQAHDIIMANADQLKELKAAEIEKNRGMAGYRALVSNTVSSTKLHMARIAFEGQRDMSNFIVPLYDQGLRGDALLNALEEADKTGTVARNREVYRRGTEYIIEAYEYDKAHKADSRRIAENALRNYVIPEPNMEKLAPKMTEVGINVRQPAPGDGREAEIHAKLVDSALTFGEIGTHLPRWAFCLLKRPGITEAEKNRIEETWLSGREGQEQVYEMFFREMEQLDPKALDVNNLNDYADDFARYDYLGSIAFENEYCMGEYKKTFSMSPEREADLKVVSRAMADIQNKFNKGLDALEHPLYKYIDDVENVEGPKAFGLLSKLNAASSEGHFATEYGFYLTSELSSNVRAKEILAYNKEYKGDERTQMLTEWYESFKQTMVDQGMDLDDPLAMARIKAQVPGNPNALYMPAMNGYDEKFNVDGMPEYPDTEWYKAHLTSANQLPMEQIDKLYELSKQGKLGFAGNDMKVNSMRVVYNDKKGKPQLSRLLIDVDVSGIYKDEQALAKELFPDAPYPFRIYNEACDFHKVCLNQVPWDDELGFDPRAQVSLAYHATLFNDYYANPDKYADPQAAKDRAAQAYVVAKFHYGADDAFKAEHEAYMEVNDLNTDPERPETVQEKALRRIGDPRQNNLIIPDITPEMVTFIDSLEPALEDEGWNMENMANRACLRVFRNNNGNIHEHPACASLPYVETKSSGWYLKDATIKDLTTSEEEYMRRNTKVPGGLGSAERANRTLSSEEKLRIAFIYESAKQGQLMINRPGETTASAIPIIPGPDGKAKVVTDFDSLGDVERKNDYYINASRVRRGYSHPNETKRMEYMKKWSSTIDRSCFNDSGSSLDTLTTSIARQAKIKGITDKASFVSQAVALTPKLEKSFREYVEGLRKQEDSTVTYVPNRIQPKYYAARRELSARARENYFGSRYEREFIERFVLEGVKRGLYTKKEADAFTAHRGLDAIFLDANSEPGTMEKNIEACRIMIKGTTEEKTRLYNERLDKLASIRTEEYRNLTDEQIVEKWPEMNEKMYPLQELIRISDDMEKEGIHADPAKLRAALMSEQRNADIQYYVSNKIQIIANPAYETVDVEQLMNADFEEICSLDIATSEGAGKEYNRLITSINPAILGLKNQAKAHITCQLMDKFELADPAMSFFSKDCHSINGDNVFDQLKKDGVVFAAPKGQDQVFAFKTSDGSHFADLDTSGEYDAVLSTFTEARRQQRIDQESKAQQALIEKEKKAEEARREAIRKARASRRTENENIEIDGEAIDALFEGYPVIISEEPPKAEPAANEIKVLPPIKTETEILREQVQEYLKTELEYQQYRLAAIIDSYGPNGQYKNKTEEFKLLSNKCAANILAYSKALEKSNKEGISNEDLEKLGTKGGVRKIKTAMLEEEGCRMTLEGLDTEKLTKLCAADKEGPEKMQAVTEFSNEYKTNSAKIAYEKDQAFKAEAREAMQAGLDQYKEFSKKLDDVIDYGQYKLGAAGFGMRRNNPGAEQAAKTCLAELFAAVTVKDIIDSKTMTYNQAEDLSNVKNLKKASKEILADPAFDRFFKTKTAQDFIETGKQTGETFDREIVNDMVKAYRVERANEMRQKQQEQAKKNVNKTGGFGLV